MLFSETTWNRIYDAERKLITLTDGRVTITVLDVKLSELVADDAEQKDACDQGQGK